MDFNSSDLMSGTLKCIFSGFLELMNSFNTSALCSLKGRLSLSSLSLIIAKYKFISSVIFSRFVSALCQSVELRAVYLPEIFRLSL